MCYHLEIELLYFLLNKKGNWQNYTHQLILWLTYAVIQLVDSFAYQVPIANNVDNSAQQVNNKTFNGIISRDTMHWTSDLFAYLNKWIYSCRIAGQFTSNFRSCSCLTMPSLSGLMIYRNSNAILDPWSFWTVISVPSFVVLIQFWMTFCYLFLLSVFKLWFSYYVSDIFCKF